MIDVCYASAPTLDQLRAALAACNQAPYTAILAHVRASVCRQLAALDQRPHGGSR